MLDMRAKPKGFVHIEDFRVVCIVGVYSHQILDGLLLETPRF